MWCGRNNQEVQDLPRWLRHMTLCFEAHTRRLWILPNPTDPNTRFVDVMGGRSLPEGEYHMCATLIRSNVRVRVRHVSETEGDLGGRFCT